MSMFSPSDFRLRHGPWWIDLAFISGMLGSVFTTAISSSCHAARSATDELEPGEHDTLRRYARDTWKSFEVMARDGELPADVLRRTRQGQWEPTKKTTPTDVAAYLWSVLAAENLGITDAREAHRRIEKVLNALGRLQRDHGFFFDRIDPRSGATLTVSPHDEKPLRQLVSAVDNSWLAAALITVGNAQPRHCGNKRELFASP